jgi:hypothetical protein
MRVIVPGYHSSPPPYRPSIDEPTASACWALSLLLSLLLVRWPLLRLCLPSPELLMT